MHSATLQKMRESHAHLEPQALLHGLDLGGDGRSAHGGVVVRIHVPGLRQPHQRVAAWRQLRRQRALLLGPPPARSSRRLHGTHTHLLRTRACADLRDVGMLLPLPKCRWLPGQSACQQLHQVSQGQPLRMPAACACMAGGHLPDDMMPSADAHGSHSAGCCWLTLICGPNAM